MNCQTGSKDCQVKIDPSEGGKTERDRKKIESFHEGLYNAVKRLKARLRRVTFVTFSLR
jgi:hypothetical protein